MDNSDRRHSIVLTDDEMLVLDAFLTRLEKGDGSHFAHRSELVALWRMTGQFEKVLWQTFDPNYDQLLERARERVLAGSENSN